MHFLKFYQFLIGNKASFLQPYTGDGQDDLYIQASLFWDKLDSLSIVFLLLFFLIGVLAAWYYYKPFNEQPNRHYLPKYWWMFFIESVKDYVKFHMADGRNIMTLGNLKRLEEKLPREKFRRVHRSFIANLTNFDYIQNMKVIYGKLAVPISDTNKDDVVKFVEEHGIN